MRDLIRQLDNSKHKTKKGYTKKLIGGAMITLGLFFLIEHLIVFGEFEFWDFLGHEWLGILLFLAGVGCFINFDRK